MTDAKPVAILKTEDLPVTITWYIAVGFTLRGQTPDDEPTWAELERDGVVLQFISGDTPWPGPPAFTGCIYLHPNSVEKVYAEIKAGVDCPWGVELRPWGARELTLQDPNGYYITFTEPD
jgi:hypothetical protein